MGKSKITIFKLILISIILSLWGSCKKESLPGEKDPTVCNLKKIGAIYEIVNKGIPLDRYVFVEGILHPSGLIWEYKGKRAALHKFLGAEGKVLAYFELSKNEVQPPFINGYKGTFKKWKYLDQTIFNDNVKKNIEESLSFEVTMDTYVFFINKKPEGCK